MDSWQRKCVANPWNYEYGVEEVKYFTQVEHKGWEFQPKGKSLEVYSFIINCGALCHLLVPTMTLKAPHCWSPLHRRERGSVGLGYLCSKSHPQSPSLSTPAFWHLLDIQTQKPNRLSLTVYENTSPALGGEQARPWKHPMKMRARKKAVLFLVESKEADWIWYKAVRCSRSSYSPQYRLK